LETYFSYSKGLSSPDEIKVISTFPACFYKTLFKQTGPKQKNKTKKAIFLERLYSLPFELQDM